MNKYQQIAMFSISAGMTFNLYTGNVPTLHAETNVPQKQEQKLEQLTEREIHRFMSLNTVQDILKPHINSGRIQDIQVTAHNLEESLQKLYNETLNAKEDAVLWFAYSPTVPKEYTSKSGLNGEKRKGIIYVKINDQYYSSKKIRFLSLGINTSNKKEHQYIETALNKFLYNCGMQSFDEKNGIKILSGTPSILMFSRSDLLKGETPEFNNSQMKHIDTLFGGPRDSKTLLQWHNAMPAYWINPNIIKPNGKFTYRFKNTDNVTKEEY